MVYCRSSLSDVSRFPTDPDARFVSWILASEVTKWHRCTVEYQVLCNPLVSAVVTTPPFARMDAKSGASFDLKRGLHTALLKHQGFFVTTEVDLAERAVLRVSHDPVLSHLVRLQRRWGRCHSLPIPEESHLYVGSGSFPFDLVVAGFQLRSPDLYGVRNIDRMLILIPCENAKRGQHGENRQKCHQVLPMFHCKSPYDRSRRRRFNLLRIETVSSETKRSCLAQMLVYSLRIHRVPRHDVMLSNSL